jgi:PKD repeat protein
MSWRTRDARDFADALDGAGAPSSREIASLIAVAERLCEAAATVQPPAAFRASFRTTLVAEAATVLTAARPATARARRQPVLLALTARRRIAIVAAPLVTALGLVGMTAASASALPGDTLYPVKRGIENTELVLKQGESENGTFRLELAGRRLDETNGLTARPSAPSDLEADTLTEYSKQADLGSGALVRSFKATNRRTDIITINRFASRAAGGLASLDGQLEGEAATALASARTQLASIVDTAAALCPSCGGIDPNLADAITAAGPTAAPLPPVEPPTATPTPTPAPTTVTPTPLTPSITVIGPDSSDASDSDTILSDDESDQSDAPTQRPSSPTPTRTTAPPPPPAPPAPKANFNWSGNDNNLVVKFKDASSNAVTWAWDFGDGDTSLKQDPSPHKYRAPGVYSVTLSVSNSARAAQTVTKRVTVPVP